MATATQILGKFAAELRYSDIPPEVAARAKDCIIDSVAIAAFGSQLPWSRMVADYARTYGAGGPCTIIGRPDVRVQAPCAALANGVFMHAFEHDQYRDPSVGAHPGATIVPAILAACEETGANGKSAIVAFVASCEVLFRVGLAAHKSRIPPESIGFHAPGLTGPYAAAIAAGCVYGHNAEQHTHALGIAGSLSSGLLAFTKSTQGGMVKRLHLGRTAESGILAARLAGSGYTGPETVLEGKFGFLDAYCRDGDPSLLTADLNKVWETARIGLKRYAAHMTANPPIQAVRNLIAQHKFSGADVAHVVVEASAKVLSHNNILEPGDVMQAQYSVPFCVAFAMFHDPDDPSKFDESAVNDPAIRAVCRNVELRVRAQPGPSHWSANVHVELKDGRKVSYSGDSVKGMLVDPFKREDLQRKFMFLTKAMGSDASARLFERLERLEHEKGFSLAY